VSRFEAYFYDGRSSDRDEEVARALSRRDERDSGRAVAPLTRAPGAIVVDTSDLTLEQVVRRLEDMAHEAS